MNQLNRKYITVLKVLSSLLISWLFLLPAKAQDSKQLTAFAREQMTAGNYQVAENVLNRVLFFDNGNNHLQLFTLLGECTYQIGDYQTARNYYDLAATNVLSDSLRAEYAFMKVLCDLHSGNYEEARVELYSLEEFLNTDQSRNYYLLSGIISYHLEEYDDARQNFLLCCEDYQKDQLLDYFDKVKKTERRYRPGIARIMSILIPGSGQIYAGDYKNGINSFLLISGLAFTGALLAQNISIIDSAIIVLPWFQRYYQGGFERAYKLTQQKQHEEKQKILISILNQLN